MRDKYIEKYELLGYSKEQAENIISNFEKAYEYIDAFIEIGCTIPIIEITKVVGIPRKLLGSEYTERKTDLQEFKTLLDNKGIKYQVDVHAGDVKELEIYPEHLYRDYRDEVNNNVSIVFDKDGKLMYFEGMSR